MDTFKVMSQGIGFVLDGNPLNPARSEDFLEIISHLSKADTLKKEVQSDLDCLALLDIFQKNFAGHEGDIAFFLSADAVIDRLTSPELAQNYFDLSKRLSHDLREKIVTAFYAGSHYCNVRAVSLQAFNILKSLPKDAQTRILSQEGTVYRLWYNEHGQELCALLRQLSRPQKASILRGCAQHHDYLNFLIPQGLADKYPPIMRALRP